MKVTDQNYRKLLTEGRHLIDKILPDLNTISHIFIRFNHKKYRRQEDFDEICVALALLQHSEE